MLALTGATLAVGAALGVASLLSDDARATDLRQEPKVTITDGARDSWEGRIGPDRTGHGVRDSWMPPGSSDRDLSRIR